MPIYICRWQNGNLSAVSASSRDHAILLLDEVGNAEACELFPVEDFMVHFRLKNKVDNIEAAAPLELGEGFGGETLDALYDRVYPVYAKALVGAVETWRTDEPVKPERVEEVLRNLNDALSVERTRQWGMILELSGNSEASRLQHIAHDISRTVAERTEARSFPRYPIRLPLAVNVDRSGESAVLVGVLINVGEGGIRGRIEGNLVPGEFVKVRSSDSRLNFRLESYAQVRYRKEETYGFAFCHVAPEPQVEVQRLCQRLASA
jgi:hypothetical protein